MDSGMVTPPPPRAGQQSVSFLRIPSHALCKNDTVEEARSKGLVWYPGVHTVRCPGESCWVGCGDVLHSSARAQR